MAGWIRVEDGLPPVDELSHYSAEVLCARVAENCNMRAVGRYWGGNNPVCPKAWSVDKRFTPTHWRPIEPLAKGEPA
jgi:hypothetical protein